MVFTVIGIYLYDFIVFFCRWNEIFFLMISFCDADEIHVQTSGVPNKSIKIVLSDKKLLIRNKNVGCFLCENVAE